MSGIRSRNTKPELLIRRGLHARGFRYRLHERSLPGKPDLVFPGLKAVLFTHGCFWHGHDCALFKWPKTRPEFWTQKIEANRSNDARTVARLTAMGWRTGIVWECALRGPGRLEPADVIARCAEWLRSERASLELRGAGGTLSESS